MKISGQLNGVNVELDRPEPVYATENRTWYESTVHRLAKHDEDYLDPFSLKLSKAITDHLRPEVWIMSPIPRATAEQLKAIGMRERDQEPVECKLGDKIWQYGVIHITGPHYPHIGKHRWVLEAVPVEKPKLSYAQSWDKLIDYLTDSNNLTAEELRVDLEAEGVDVTTFLDRIKNIVDKGKKSMEKSICADCTTPAILCPNGNESRDNIISCASKNIGTPVEKEPTHTSCADGVCPVCNKTHASAPAPAPKVVAAKINPVTFPCPVCGTACWRSCDNCRLNNHRLGMPCMLCSDPPDYSKWQFEEPAPKVTDDKITEYAQAWLDTVEVCCQCGMKREEGVETFIRSLAQRAGEGYTVEQISKYFQWGLLNGKTVYDLWKNINDPQDGIAAVTERNK